ncbi:rhodanese-like domain-containing protein [Vibrio sp. TRT 17S01]|uniref:rhodanese-like domain-containing protein n=1 Tax=Vibrio sp. TRT 17S01 TaxID=3418505 RepID=UPI003CF430F2
MLKRLATFITFVLLCIAIIPTAFASERAEKGWQLIEQGALLVDVRTPQEFNHRHVSGAVNYPLQDLNSAFANINKDRLIVLYCRSGNRSGQAYDRLIKKGFTNLHNAGGLNEMLSTQPKR